MPSSRACFALCALLAWAPAWAEYRLETVAEGLAWPWCIAFLPDGDMLVTERDGGLRIIRDGELDAKPIAGVPPAYVRSQGGLFDVALHPEFAENRLLYLTYAHGSPDANGTRLARARFDGEKLSNLEPLFTVAPLKDTPMHYGGRMLFLPDGTLLLTTGDGFLYREDAQRLDNLLGKVVRLNDDGSIPDDNPFLGQAEARDEIWSYGHRNPQGLAFDANTGVVYLHEHGAKGGDELNVIESGVNYGWPVATLGVDYNGARISPFTEYPGMRSPTFHWTPSIAPAGIAFYSGDAFPQWQGDLFVTSLVFKNVERLDVQGGEVQESIPMFGELGERIRDVRMGPAGHLFILTDAQDGNVVRVVPSEAAAPRQASAPA